MAAQKNIYYYFFITDVSSNNRQFLSYNGEKNGGKFLQMADIFSPVREKKLNLYSSNNGNIPETL